MWTHIISLKHCDAQRLGFDHAEAWRSLLRLHQNEIAEAMHIPIGLLRWYAAFHDEGEHPHVHMMAWSVNPKEGFLNQDGIRDIRSKLTNDIFKQELLHIYEQKSESRDELVRESRRAMLELVRQMQNGVCNHPELEPLMLQLSQTLETVKGKKSYGYLPKPAKRLVCEIVDQMERIKIVSDCYDRWLELQAQVDGYYTGNARQRQKLSEQKEFTAIKNAVIQEAERIRLGEFTFEDAGMDAGDAPENERSVSYDYWTLKEIILDKDQSLEDRDEAAEGMRELANDGDAYAQYFLGCLYRDGGLLIPDTKLAADWFCKAAYDHNLAAAQYQLGRLLLSDDVEIGNPALGMEWLEIAAENGSDNAAYLLGKEYLRGKSVLRVAGKATGYLTQASQAGNRHAQYALGKLSLEHQDLHAAKHWFTQSAAQGNTCAQFFLDRMDSLRPPSVMLAATRLLHHMSRIFQDNSLPQSSPVGMKLDRKQLRKLRAKKIARGHKPDNHEEYTGPTLSM